MLKNLMKTVFCTTMIAGPIGANANDLSADVIHWWTSESEAKAVAVFADAFNAAGGEWVDAAVAGADAAKASASTRIQAGDPSVAFVANSVKDVEDLISAGLLIDVTAVAEAEKWADNMPAAIVDAITRDGKFYGAPTNLGVNNYLWTSAKALEAIGATEPPKTWDEFFVMGDQLKEKGIIPFAMPGKWYWYMMTFGNVLATQDIDAYNAFHALDESVLDTDAFKAAAEIYARLRDYTDSGAPGREWNLSNAMVMNGEAAFYIMGDWAKGEITAGGMTPGKDVLCTVGLDASPVSMSGDVLVFPSIDGAETPTPAQTLLAEVIGSPDVQRDYNALKGSLPVRTDVTGADFDACAQTALAAVDANSSVSGYPVLISPDAAGTLGDILGNFWVESDATAEDLIEEIRDEFSMLN